MKFLTLLFLTFSLIGCVVVESGRTDVTGIGPMAKSHYALLTSHGEQNSIFQQADKDVESDVGVSTFSITLKNEGGYVWELDSSTPKDSVEVVNIEETGVNQKFDLQVSVKGKLKLVFLGTSKSGITRKEIVNLNVK